MPPPALSEPVRAEGGRSWRRPVSLVALLGLGVLLAVLVVSSYSVTVVIDEGSGNTGDETNSLTLAWTAYDTGVPSYGVLSDGTPWTLGGLTLPVYYALYGSILAHVDPDDRIDAARAVSRVLAGLALLFVLVALAWAGGFPQLPDAYRLATLLLSVMSVCFLFAAHESFVLVSSFGRVDALGLLAVCLSAAAFAAFRRSPGFVGLFAYALTVVFAYLSNNIAFVLVAVTFALTVAAQLRRERLATYARAVGTALLVGFVVDFLVNHVWLTPTVSTSAQYPDSVAVADDLVRRMTRSPRVVLSYAWERYPEVIGAIAVTMAAALACLLWASRSRRRGALFSFREFALAGLVVPPVVGWLGLTAIPGTRIGYAPMLLLAVILPYLIVVTAARGLHVAWAGPLLLLAVLTQLLPSIWTGHAEWGRSVVVGATPRWQETSGAQRAAEVANTVRGEHLQSLGGYLARTGISPVLTDDPLFTLRNGSKPRYLFVNQEVTTPREEWRVLRDARSKLRARSLVTNVFGRDSFLRSYGYPLLKRALSAQPERETVEVTYPEGVVVARRLFTSRSRTGERGGVEYSYLGDFSATPFALYSFELRMSPG